LQVVKTTLAGVDVWKDERYIAEVSANVERESDRVSEARR